MVLKLGVKFGLIVDNLRLLSRNGAVKEMKVKLYVTKLWFCKVEDAVNLAKLISLWKVV